MTNKILYISSDELMFQPNTTQIKVWVGARSKKIIFNLDSHPANEICYVLGWWKDPYWHLALDSLLALNLNREDAQRAITQYYQLQIFH